MKIYLVGAKMLQKEGRTDRNDKSNSHSPQFCDMPKKVYSNTMF